MLLVDDHPIVREGIKSHLAAQEGLEVVADAGDGHEALVQARKHRPDVVLMDISMPRMNGLEAITQLRRQAPRSKILVLTMHNHREYISQIFRLGACGYVLKDTSPSELITAIRTVHAGQAFFSPVASKVLLDELAGGASQVVMEKECELSPREREVLVRIAEGQSNKGIAHTLGVGVRTIETHRERIMHKLSIRSIAGLTKYAIAKGMVALE